MKRIIKLIAILVVTVLSFSLVACAGSATQEGVKDSLVAKIAESDFTSGELSVNVKGGTNFYDAVARIRKLNGDYDVDFYFITYPLSGSVSENEKTGGAFFARQDSLYLVDFGGEAFTTKVSTSNYEAEIDNLITTKKANFSYLAERETIYALLGGVLQNTFDFPPSTAGKIPSFTDTLVSFLQNRASLQKGDAVEVYNGYRLSIDVMSNLTASFQSLQDIGKTIDDDATFTLEQLYFLPEFTSLFKDFLVYTDAQVAEELLNVIKYKLERGGYVANYEVIKTLPKENAYEYLYRFINTKVQGLTIASMRIKDLIEMIGFKEGTSVKGLMVNLTEDIMGTVKEFTDTLKVIYFFDEDMNFTRVSMDFNLKKNDVFSTRVWSMESAHVKVDYRLKDVSASFIDITE